MDQQNRKQVMDKIDELARHVEMNKDFESRVHYFIIPDKYGGRYSVYRNEKLLKKNLNSLPGRPTALRPAGVTKNHNNTSSLRLEWNFKDRGFRGFPCSFLIQHRVQETCDSWTEQRTRPGKTKATITYKNGSKLEVRVVAESCIGRGEFSDVLNIDEETNLMKISKVELDGGATAKTGGNAKEIQPSTPTGLDAVQLVTPSTAELSCVKPPEKNPKPFYRIQFWHSSDKDLSSAEL